MIIFDLRTASWRNVNLNEQLRRYNPAYVERFGFVGSEKWFAMFDEGKLSVTSYAGEITHVGPRADHWEEDYDAVEVLTDRRECSYDREDYWLHPSISVGAWVAIDTVQVSNAHPDKPVTTIVTVRVRVIQ